MNQLRHDRRTAANGQQRIVIVGPSVGEGMAARTLHLPPSRADALSS